MSSKNKTPTNTDDDDDDNEREVKCSPLTSRRFAKRSGGHKLTKEARALTQEFLANAPKTLRCRTKEESERIRNKVFSHRLPQHVDPSYYSFCDSDEDFTPPEESGTHPKFDPQNGRSPIIKNKKQTITFKKRKPKVILRQVNENFYDIPIIPNPNDGELDLKATLQAHMQDVISADFTRAITSEDVKDVYRRSNASLLHTRSFYKRTINEKNELAHLYGKYTKNNKGKIEETNQKSSKKGKEKLSKIDEIAQKADDPEIKRKLKS